MCRCIDELRRRLQQNEHELQEKNQLIMQLKCNKESPKKKLSLTSNDAALHSAFHKKLEEANRKI